MRGVPGRGELLLGWLNPPLPIPLVGFFCTHINIAQHCTFAVEILWTQLVFNVFNEYCPHLIFVASNCPLTPYRNIQATIPYCKTNSKPHRGCSGLWGGGWGGGGALAIQPPGHPGTQAPSHRATVLASHSQPTGVRTQRCAKQKRKCDPCTNRRVFCTSEIHIISAICTYKTHNACILHSHECTQFNHLPCLTITPTQCT